MVASKAGSTGRMSVVLASLVGVMFVSTDALSQPVAPVRSMVRATFEQTRTTKADATDVVVLETGVVLIDPAGRCRIERLTSDTHTAEIVDHRTERRSVLDLRRGLVVTGSDMDVLPGRFSLPGGPVLGRPSGMSAHRQRGEPLGTKLVDGGLELTGTRFVVERRSGAQSLTHVVELWTYPFTSSAMVPVILEEVFEDDQAITVRRITSASRVRMDEAAFGIPPAFTWLSRPDAATAR